MSETALFIQWLKQVLRCPETDEERDIRERMNQRIYDIRRFEARSRDTRTTDDASEISHPKVDTTLLTHS